MKKSGRAVFGAPKAIRLWGISGGLMMFLGLSMAAGDPAVPVVKASAPTPTPSSIVPGTPGEASTATPTGVPGSPTATDTPTPSPTITSTPTETGTPTPSPTRTPVIARSGMALLPTGYSNRPDRVDGFNLDLLFTYYIGSILERRSDSEGTEFLNPLRLWLFTGDVKYAWIDENGNLPGFSTGFMNTLLLQGSAPGATATGGSFKFTASSMGGVYAALSKSVARDTSVHLGYMRGNLRDLLGKLGSTVRRISPNRNHSELLTLMTEDLADVRNESAPNIVYTGFDTRFLGTFWRFELWKPFPLSKEPLLVNAKVDRLFSFNLAYEKWQGGHALLGYFNFRFTIIPSAPRKAALP